LIWDGNSGSGRGRGGRQAAYISVVAADVTEVVDAYLRAWNEPDEAVRRTLLEQAVTDDCELAGPTGTFRGRDAILGLIAALQGRAGDAVMARAGPVEHELPDDIRFAWQVRTPGGDALLGGTDTVEVAADGRLRHIAVSM
jgi:hypothetical protein